MTLIVAPDGAIFALLAIASAAPIVPDEAAELWLREQSLIEDTPHGVTALTSRGAAFVRIINSTPLPVKVERWDDPREQAQPAPPAPPAVFDPLALGIAIATALRSTGAPTPAAVLSQPATPRPAPQGARPVTVVTSIPPGYREVPEAWTRIPAGQWPGELRPDADVVVIYRDGRVSAPRAAQSIIWQHREAHANDDPIAFRETGNDTMRSVTSSAPVN